MKPCPSYEAGLQPGSNQEEILHSSIAASLGPLLPWSSHPSPLVVKLGPSPHPQVLVQFREGWKPAQQGGQSLNRSDGAVTSPPSSPVPLLAPQRQKPHRTNHFITLWVHWGLWEGGARRGCGAREAWGVQGAWSSSGSRC